MSYPRESQRFISTASSMNDYPPESGKSRTPVMEGWKKKKRRRYPSSMENSMVCVVSRSKTLLLCE